MIATVATILTAGTASGLTAAGSASTYVGKSLISGSIGAAGNTIGQISSGADFDYADPGLAFVTGFIPGGFLSTLANSTSTSMLDVTVQKGMQTPFSAGTSKKNIYSTMSDFGFGLIGGRMGNQTENLFLGVRIFGEAAGEHLNNKLNEGIEGE